MNLLGAKLYDPAAAVSKATSALLAMTALDTTNLRVAFTIPAHGMVRVRMMGVIHGATTFPSILLGVMDGANIRGRVAPVQSLGNTAVATALVNIEADFVIAGLTPGAVNWDAAYGVETVVASSAIKYGGPNDTTLNNAFGGFAFEVWDPQSVPVAAPGAAGGLQIAGSNAATSYASITANITGNVSGSVGSVTGAVGSVTGAVGSVTGNVSGNVTGSVGSVATGGITAGSIAADAIGASELAADAITEIQSGLATASGVTSATSGLATAANLATVAGYLDTEMAAVLAAVDTEVAAIKAKTDNIPTDPADASDIAAAFSTVNGTLSTIGGYIDTEVAAIKVVTDKLNTALEADSAVYRFTANALEQAPVGEGGGGLDAAGVRAAIGMSSANLDTQLADLPTNSELATALTSADDATLAAVSALNNISSAQVQTAAEAALTAYDPPTRAEATADKDAIITEVNANETKIDGIKTKTDSLTFSVPGNVDANVTHINDGAVQGTGTDGDEWGPA